MERTSKMEIIKPSFVFETDIDGTEILKDIERFGRTCYKSEEKITENSAEEFVRMILKSGHESVIEHISVTVRFICDRGVTHEIVRHRLVSYSQESTRYCNYNKKGMTVIDPIFFIGDEEKYRIWEQAMKDCERAYNALIVLGATPQEARTVLPNSLKTEIVMTCNLREWRHFFKLRTSERAHPQMREITIPLLKSFKEKIPVIFDDISEK